GQPAERGPPQRTGFGALEDRGAQALGHLERRGTAGRQPFGPARDRVEHRPAERVIRVPRRRAQLIAGSLTRPEDEPLADALAAQQERFDGLALVPPLGREVEQELVEPVPRAAERGEPRERGGGGLEGRRRAA